MRRRAGVVTAIGTAVLAAVAVAPQAQAQFAVIDVAAIRHLVVQIDYWRQQLEATHAALTGPRGMEALLAITPEQRNYLPGEWEAMRAALEGQSAEYGTLARAVGAVVELRAVLSEAVLAEMTEAEREQLIEARQTAAGLVVMTRQAYAEASARFGSLAQLVAAIGGALDAKAVADLQARIGAEQAMLANEQAKLAVLYQMIEAERWVQGQQLKELGIAAHGRFDERFRPTPP
jgi:type IV secretion system protein VirB5